MLRYKTIHHRGDVQGNGAGAHRAGVVQGLGLVHGLGVVGYGLQIYYLSSANIDGTNEYCERLGWKRLQDYNPAQRRWKYLKDLAQGMMLSEDTLLFEDELQNEDYFPSLPFAAMFSCFKAKGLKVTCLLCYCSEGDNMPDSFQLAEAASKVVGLRDSDIQETLNLINYGTSVTEAVQAKRKILSVPVVHVDEAKNAS
ncbi:hypothetical protein AgCh_039724 [Apium graveolens]